MKRFVIVIYSLLFAACAPTHMHVEETPSLTVGAASFTSTPTPTPSSTPTHTPAATTDTLSIPTRTPLPTLEPGRPITITTLYMIDTASGWAIESGDHLLRTTDAGNTWQEVTPQEGGFFSFIGASHAFAVVPTQIPCKDSGCQSLSGMVMWRTSNGGQTWQRGEPFAPGVPYHQPISMQFIDDTNGWFLFVDMVGMSHSTYETLLLTHDGGVSWMPSRERISGLCISGGMVFLNEVDGWIGNDCRWNMGAIDCTRVEDFVNGQAMPALVRSYDGGETWPDFYLLPPPEQFPANLTSPDADGDRQIWCGITKMERMSREAFTLRWSCSQYFPDPPKDIFNYGYLTPDAGMSWHSWLATGNEEFVDANTGWRLIAPDENQSGQLQQSTDGGSTWVTIKTVAWQSGQFDFVSEQIGWAIVTNDDATSLLYTADGGSSWAGIDPVIVP